MPGMDSKVSTPLNVVIDDERRIVFIRPTKEPTEWTEQEADAADETIRALTAEYHQKRQYQLWFEDYGQRSDATRAANNEG